jgi:hypothetical protein
MSRFAELLIGSGARESTSNRFWRTLLGPLAGIAVFTLAVGSSHTQAGGRGRMMQRSQPGRIGGMPQVGGLGMMTNRVIPGLSMGNPNFNGLPGGGNIAMTNPLAANLANMNAAALANLYGSAALSSGLYGGSSYSNGYGNGYGSYMDPNYAYVKGGADAATSQANFMTSQQQADLLKQRVRAERLTNRRKSLEEAEYERAQDSGAQPRKPSTGQGRPYAPAGSSASDY